VVSKELDMLVVVVHALIEVAPVNYVVPDSLQTPTHLNDTVITRF
jgi:hypothetical protein